MPRLNLLLLAVLTLCSLSLVTAQHEARKTFAELEREQGRGQQIEIEFGQLQLEQSTWAMHTRIDKLARERLRMARPDEARIRVLRGAARTGDGA